MMSAARGLVFGLVGLGWVLGCSTSRDGGDANKPQKITASGIYTHAATGMRFPEKTGSFTRLQMFRYDSQELDVSVGYVQSADQDTLQATAYLYPEPKFTTASAKAGLANKEFQDRKREILTSHKGSKLLEEGAIDLSIRGKRYQGQKAVMEFNEPFNGGVKTLRSHLYVFCFVEGNWTVKYRFTHQASANAQRSIESFMRSVPLP